MMAESLNIPKTVVHRTLKEDLGKRNLCARFVSHALTSEQREDILAKILSRWPMETKFFLNKIIAGDETRCFAYDPETKRQSSEWVVETSHRPKKLKFQDPESRIC